MDASELDTKAWGKNGPLKDCKLCRTFASAIVTATLYTPPEEAQCFQIEIVRAVAREGSKCIAKNDPNFPGLPSVPVINKPSQEQIADLVDDISNFIIVQSRIQKCAQKDAIAANATAKCLENPFPGFLDAYNDVSIFYILLFQILRDKTGHFEKMFSEALNFVGFLIDAITNRSSQICNAY
ncbi:unnamed protein product [Toxocara canis]|uniref:Saposin B-type domain-containing protein n=1 Tax=Toxocara canis TaxID=6265 RepID=A0A183VAN6_TOXCA|nr:unnamed protein product [Toxocara canis]